MSVDVAAVQEALEAEGLDGWLLYDFQGSNPIAARVAKRAGAPRVNATFQVGTGTTHRDRHVDTRSSRTEPLTRAGTSTAPRPMVGRGALGFGDTTGERRPVSRPLGPGDVPDDTPPTTPA